MITEFDGKYAFLSNFYHAPFTYDGIEYPTNEHFFQAMKTLDQEERKKIARPQLRGKLSEWAVKFSCVRTGKKLRLI